MSILAMIAGATSKLASGVGALKSASGMDALKDMGSAIDKAYKDSPLGSLEDSIFSGDADSDFSYGGGGGMKHATLEPTAPAQYTDATGGLQSAMSQAGILNPAAGFLKGGTGVAPVTMQPLSPYTPEKIEIDPAPSQLSEVDRIEAEADKVAKQKRGALMEEEKEQPILTISN